MFTWVTDRDSTFLRAADITNGANVLMGALLRLDDAGWT